ncbi:hypothetical protein DPX16_8519 [Anabarilius grahami]|uniref:Uncharacterized protein n=1 Tax=Anabarilius grahami TaxID=495550 RepID=A0A3N0Y959_ANAGA|nr:hypothetical protein DPX16_8519 [Anabarilius grahami]
MTIPLIPGPIPPESTPTPEPSSSPIVTTVSGSPTTTMVIRIQASECGYFDSALDFTSAHQLIGSTMSCHPSGCTGVPHLTITALVHPPSGSAVDFRVCSSTYSIHSFGSTSLPSALHLFSKPPPPSWILRLHLGPSAQCRHPGSSDL